MYSSDPLAGPDEDDTEPVLEELIDRRLPARHGDLISHDHAIIPQFVQGPDRGCARIHCQGRRFRIEVRDVEQAPRSGLCEPGLDLPLRISPHSYRPVHLGFREQEVEQARVAAWLERTGDVVDDSRPERYADDCGLPFGITEARPRRSAPR